MKKIFIFLALTLSTSWVTANSEEKIVEAIENSDPEILRDLLIPGFLISIDTKNKLIKLAQEVTNTTHSQLHSFEFFDIVNFFKGALYAGLSVSFGYLAFDYLADARDLREFLSNFSFMNFSKKARTSHGREAGPLEKKIFIGCLASLGAYFGAKSLGTFNRIITNHGRLETHYNALTIEAIIQRLPAFDNGCFVPGSLN